MGAVKLFEDRLPEIKAYFNLREEFRKVYPDAIKRDNKTVVCPHCADRGGSALISATGYHCFQCATEYTIIGFQMLHNNQGKAAAIEALKQIIDGKSSAIRVNTHIKTLPKPPKKQEAPPFSMPIRGLFDWCRRVDRVMPYFQSRGIKPITVYRKRLGYTEPMTTKPYEYADGSLEWLKAPRYTIPYIIGDLVVSVNMRLDMTYAESYLSNPENEWLISKIRADFAAQRKILTSEIDDKKLIKAMFGPKYWRKGQPHVYNPYHRAAQTALVITEGEFDAIAIEEVGMKAIAAKSYSKDIELAAANAKHILVVADNDPNQVVHGKVVNSGMNHALKIVNRMNSLRPGLAHVLVPPDGYKDANDMHIDRVLESWLHNAGIEKTLHQGLSSKFVSI